MKTDPKNKSAMRKLVVISFLTLDGVMQAPGGKEEDTERGFKYGGWQLPFFEDDDDTVSEELGKMGALLIGRKTYDIFASYWPTVGKSIEKFGPFMNNITKYVASKTLQKTEWQNSILLKDHVAEAVAGLKEKSGKDIYMFGSGDLCQTLMRHNLIDEYLLMIYPLALGDGKQLFQQGGPKQDLELLKSKTTKSGVLVLTYKVKS
jgi:dihydrofolate reductase